MVFSDEDLEAQRSLREAHRPAILLNPEEDVPGHHPTLAFVKDLARGRSRPTTGRPGKRCGRRRGALAAGGPFALGSGWLPGRQIPTRPASGIRREELNEIERS